MVVSAVLGDDDVEPVGVLGGGLEFFVVGKLGGALDGICRLPLESARVLGLHHMLTHVSALGCPCDETEGVLD